MRRQGVRPKWLKEGRAALAANSDFYALLEGTWWEKINDSQGGALSSFTICVDPATGTLILEGDGYDKNGQVAAKWRSEMSDRGYYVVSRLALATFTNIHPFSNWSETQIRATNFAAHSFFVDGGKEILTSSLPLVVQPDRLCQGE